MEPVKTAGILTLGCKVNQYESEAIAEGLEREGFTVLPPTEACGLYIINTCTVTAESDRKARQFIRRAIHRNPKAFILVTGCFAQVAPEQIAAIEGVDFVCGNAGKMDVVREAAKLVREGRKNVPAVILNTAPDANGFEPMKITRFDRTRAYIKIEDGCESRCTYCIIPTARGKIRSKSPDDVLEEVRTLTAGGCREIVLTGIETASYGKDLSGCGLADLLCKIDRIPNVGRIRLGSLDPSLMKPDFVARIAGLSSLAPHFHLSMQSGSDTVLARMKRKYNSRMALEGMERLRAAIPDIQFTTDMIVGFPQETDAEFEESLRFLEAAEFLNVHVFPYSKRQGTPAATMPGQIPEPVKHERVRVLSDAEAQIRRRILGRMHGQTRQVLFETDETGIATGHSPDFLEIACPAPEPLHAEIRTVRILSDNGTVCLGELL